MNKKTIGLVVTVISMVLFVAAGTYAFWYWSSIGNNKTVLFNTSSGIDSSYIVYDAGESSFIGDFKPTNSFCESINTTISFYKTEKASDVKLSATVYMDVNYIDDSILTSDGVYWIVTKGDNSITCDSGLTSIDVLNYGSFNNVDSSETIVLLDNLDVSAEKQQFTIWIWVDASGDDLESIVGKTVDTNVWTEIHLNTNEPSQPELDAGMIPVTIANDGTVKTISAYDSDWYDYDNKEWANIVLVTGESRINYLNSTGRLVSEDDILAYYVWIPRYKYKMDQVNCSDVKKITEEEYPQCYGAPYVVSDSDYTKLVEYIYDINGIACDYACYSYEDAKKDADALLAGERVYMYETNTCGLIQDDCESSYSTFGWAAMAGITYKSTFFPNVTTDKILSVEFESITDEKSIGDAVNTYYTHPSFTFGEDELSGIWVGKYLTSGGMTTPIIKNTDTVNYLNAKEHFITSIKFSGGVIDESTGNVTFSDNNVYGLTSITDSHVMKNSEWGAVAYLQNSRYGVGNFTSENSTGNSSGVMNMKGKEHFVMAYGNDNLSVCVDGEFEGEGVTCHQYATMKVNSKYYNKYTSSDIKTACDGHACLGHGLSELNFVPDSRIEFSSNSWLIRGVPYYDVDSDSLEYTTIVSTNINEGYENYYNVYDSANWFSLNYYVGSRSVLAVK